MALFSATPARKPTPIRASRPTFNTNLDRTLYHETDESSTPLSPLYEPSTKLAGSKRRSFSSQGGSLLTRMLRGSSSNSVDSKTDSSETASDRKSPSPNAAPQPIAVTGVNTADQPASGEKRHTNGSPPTRQDTGGSTDKKRRSSSVSSKASSFLASAKSSFGFSPSSRHSPDMSSPIQRLGKQDPALAVPQGHQNNSAGESAPGPKSTFRVGVWEDRNRKCRRTMEDTHSFLYNFLDSHAVDGINSKSDKSSVSSSSTEIQESDNGYFAIFDGHAGTFAADWCGKKLHIVLEDIVKKNPNAPLPELLDQTFTSCDAQLEKLPLKNSGCTAAIAVLRWENRSSSDRQNAAMPNITLPAVKNGKAPEPNNDVEKTSLADKEASAQALVASKPQPNKQRVLYTANVGDARIILCRNGKALRLSYDHKGSDENEGKRISNAGGLILNNRVNGVLAVTRALGDAYMKDLVTGHPYTTETVIQPDLDEFIIIACDGVSIRSISTNIKSMAANERIALGCMRRPRSRRSRPEYARPDSCIQITR